MTDSTQKSRQVTRGLRSEGWKRRRNYPSGPLVAGVFRTADRKVITLYSDRTFLVRDVLGGAK
jgi:hypothetical protein